MDDELEVIGAFEALRIEASVSRGLDCGADLLVEGIPVVLRRRALVAEETAQRLLSEVGNSRYTLLVVADRVTRGAREILTSNGAGYLDLRGHLALRASGLVVDAEVPPMVTRSARKDPLSGAVGLEVATALMMSPDVAASVRGTARQIGRSASTVSEVFNGFQERELIDKTRKVADDRLFWEVAARWPTERIILRELPPRNPRDPLARTLRMGVEGDQTSTGWALTDSAAALAYNAPVALKENFLIDFYVPDKLAARRAATLLGVPHRSSDGRCAVRVAPVPTICRDRIVDRSIVEADWPLAHPLFVALDLAQDRGRGREILAGWDPEPRWARVW